MKHIVIFDEFNEIDLKPSDLLHKYFELTEVDVRSFLLNEEILKVCTCPGCHNEGIKSAFLKFGMRYQECMDCGTLYVSPRPDDSSIEDYYYRSSARKFWRDKISKQTQQKRKEKIIKPRFEWILDSTQEYLPDAKHLVDINTDQYGYIEEMIDSTLFEKKTLLQPYVHLGERKLNGDVTVIDSIDQGADTLEGLVDVVTLFEVADRKADIDSFFEKVSRMLRKNGLCFMTDILISGFDLQTLWDRSENIFPPDRLNLFSVEGLQALFERHNFECIEFSTPGVLDVEMVLSSAKNNPDVNISRFMEYILYNRSLCTRQSFQEFLQKNLLSSYGRIMLRKN